MQSGIMDAAHGAHTLSVMDWVWIALLAVLLINAFWQMHRHGHACECCHDHDHEHHEEH